MAVPLKWSFPFTFFNKLYKIHNYIPFNQVPTVVKYKPNNKTVGYYNFLFASCLFHSFSPIRTIPKESETEVHQDTWATKEDFWRLLENTKFIHK